jgi:hypothetical protein
VAAQLTVHETEGVEKLVLRDVTTFLSQRNLEYFQGFRKQNLPVMEIKNLGIFSGDLFTQIPLPSDFSPKIWARQTPHPVFTPMYLPVRFPIEKGPWLND